MPTNGSTVDLQQFEFIEVIDSHTGGEPTRCVTNGVPDLGTGSLAERCEVFRTKFSNLRSAIVNEPRGSEVIVGALLCEPDDPSCVAGVIFFNNVSTLHMCGHGTIGVAVTLAHLGKIQPGTHAIDTPVGKVPFELHDDGQRVSLQNVPSYRYKTNIEVEVALANGDRQKVVGDIAWGGNWFFLVANHGQLLESKNTQELTSFASGIKAALQKNGITGEDGGEIDHIELFGDSEIADSKSFVLCPGGAYDRSPCGTGTSAKLACLAADGKLEPDTTWRQESIIGSVFEGSYQRNDDGTITPTITGSAWVTAESKLLLNSSDPFIWGIEP